METSRTTATADRRAPTSLRVRRALSHDARDAAAVLRASILKLCVADHSNDPVFLAGWLANKTPRNVRTWIEGPGLFVVAEERGGIVGVGAAVPPGEITLNYVRPEARFRGVSKAVLNALEAHVCAHGHTRATLTSTRTAHRFYRAMGYVDVSESRVEDGVAVLRMFRDFPALAPIAAPLANPAVE